MQDAVAAYLFFRCIIIFLFGSGILMAYLYTLLAHFT